MTIIERSLSITDAMPFSPPDNAFLSDLPLFRDIKEALILERQQQQQNRRTFNNRNREQIANVQKKKTNSSTGDTSSRYIPPLSAYNALEETPYYPRAKNNRGGRFDELSMRVEQAQQRLKSIRTLGWDYIRPIGINDTMQLLKKRKNDDGVKNSQAPSPETHLQQQDHHGIVLPPNFQENGFEASFHEYNAAADQSGNMGPEDASNEAEQEEEEDEISYDYDAEFARVEDEEEDQIEGEREAHRNILGNGGNTRDVSIQQFVETSHIEGNPYEIDDEYENPQLDVDLEQGDSRDFTEIPWINVSDTVQSVDTPRIGSLNGITDQIVPPRDSSRHRHISYNDSEGDF